jgi:hypothetical protein
MLRYTVNPAVSKNYLTKTPRNSVKTTRSPGRPMPDSAPAGRGSLQRDRRSLLGLFHPPLWQPAMGHSPFSSCSAFNHLPAPERLPADPWSTLLLEGYLAGALEAHGCRSQPAVWLHNPTANRNLLCFQLRLGLFGTTSVWLRSPSGLALHPFIPREHPLDG